MVQLQSWQWLLQHHQRSVCKTTATAVCSVCLSRGGEREEERKRVMKETTERQHQPKERAWEVAGAVQASKTCSSSSSFWERKEYDDREKKSLKETNKGNTNGNIARFQRCPARGSNVLSASIIERCHHTTLSQQRNCKTKRPLFQTFATTRLKFDGCHTSDQFETEQSEGEKKRKHLFKCS